MHGVFVLVSVAGRHAPYAYSVYSNVICTIFSDKTKRWSCSSSECILAVQQLGPTSATSPKWYQHSTKFSYEVFA